MSSFPATATIPNRTTSDSVSSASCSVARDVRQARSSCGAASRRRHGRALIPALSMFGILAQPLAGRQGGQVWSPRNLTTRYEHAMAYDSVRGRVVLFGGMYSNLFLEAATWEWDGLHWMAVNTGAGAPSQRRGHAMAFDRRRGVTVLFGGRTDRERLGDTWEWDGRAWRLCAPEGPSRRSDHAMTYDSVRGVTLLHGGSTDFGGGNETWSWDGVAWKIETAGDPGARAGHGMVFDERRGVAVLNGAGTWEWNGVQWTRRSTTGPPTGFHPGMAYDSRRGVVVHFGDSDLEGEPVTWLWDGNDWSTVQNAKAPVRPGLAMAYDEAHGECVMFGGRIPDPWLEDTWFWDGIEWESRPTTRRPPRPSGHAMTFDSRRGVSVALGENPFLYNYATTEWDGRLWREIVEGEMPDTNGRNMTFDSRIGRTLVFAGSDTLANIWHWWEWDGEGWVRNEPLDPHPVGYSSALAFDAARGEVVRFGGYSGDENATWLYDGAGWRRFEGESPPNRYDHSLTYDARRQVTVLFGGSVNGIASSETWEWDGTEWTFRTASGPPARSRHAAAFDSKRGLATIYGGTSSNIRYMDDVWAWDGEKWSPHGSGPIAVYDHAMSYDSLRDAVVYVGGEMYANSGRTVTAATWELLADENGDGRPDVDDPCRSIRGFRARCRARGERGWRVSASCFADLPSGTPLTLRLDGKQDQLLLVETPGKRVRARWNAARPGVHEVCILQCSTANRCVATWCE